MDQSKPRIDQSDPPQRPGLAGTRLIHYGPFSDTTLEQTRTTEGAPVAVLVCHGMGQQVRYETISQIAQAIRTEAKAKRGNVRDVEVNLSKLADDSFLARAEVGWTDADAHDHNVHVYEAYWAPLTEGRVTYWDTVKFLLEAAWNGLRYSFPLGPHKNKFQRWLFGGPKEMQIGHATFPALLCVLAFLLVQVGIIGFVLLELAQQYKTVVAQPLPAVDLQHFWTGLRQLVHDWARWAGPLVPEHATLLHAPIFSRDWWWGFGKMLGWFALIAEALVVRYFLIEYVGDVAAYISPYKDSKFDELRHEIQKVGFDAGRTIYGFGPPNFAVPHYSKIVVVGHSLGSVLAYDTLNALINLDNVSPPLARRDVVDRTRALVTFGSPLDKTAFIFRMQPNNEQDWIREQLAASVQPLIVDYPLYRPLPPPPPAVPPPGFDWVNIWSHMDIISGELNYYDVQNDPTRPLNHPPCVQNMPDYKAWVPLYAHVQYWNNPLLREQLYRFVS